MNENTEETTVAEDMSSNFNLENDFKVDPLVPNGNYTGNVVQVEFKADKANINWKVVLDGNGGFMNDGETPIDGVALYFNNWLPKKGDETLMTPSGRSTKFQSKVNQLGKFAKGMGLNMNTIDIIKEAIDNGDYIGLAVKVKVTTNEFPVGSGTFNNQIEQMVAA
jgi:hypothetical protein